MSDHAYIGLFDGATPVPVWTRPKPRGFAAADRTNAGGFSAWVSEPEEPVDETPPSNPGADSLIEQGYALGLAEGRRVAEAQLSEERAALARLLDAAAALQPEPPAALAAMLAATVRRLVAQVVGEVEIDAGLLADRIDSIAALIVDETAPSRLRLNPADVARLAGMTLPLAAIADPNVTPGSILVETGSGWIEDGPAVRLEKLHGALDRLGAPK